MYRSVLTSASFVAWSKDHLIPLVAHDELDHEEVRETQKDGTETRRCTLYPGLACRDHLDASVDTDNARGEGLIAVPFIELCPNSWLVLPTGKVTRVEEEDQFDPKRVRERVEEAQKALGPAVTDKVYARARPLVEKAAEAVEGDLWREALEACAEVEKAVQPLHAGLETMIRGHLESIEEDALFEFEDARDDAKATPDQKRERIQAVHDKVDVVVLGKRLPSAEAAAAWLREHPPTTK